MWWCVQLLVASQRRRGVRSMPPLLPNISPLPLSERAEEEEEIIVVMMLLEVQVSGGLKVTCGVRFICCRKSCRFRRFLFSCDQSCLA